MAFKFTADIFADTVTTPRGDEGLTVREKTVRAFDCSTCNLNLACHSPKMKYIGEGAKRVVIVGSHPSKWEDAQGSLGYGPEFEFLRDTLREVGVDIYKDCYYITAIGCRTKTSPTLREISSCSNRVQRIVSRLNPRAVILLGQAPFQTFIRPRLTGRMIGMEWAKFAGDVIPDQQYKYNLVPTWDTALMLSRKDYDDGDQSKPLHEQDRAYYNTWKKHLVSAFNAGDFYERSYRNDVQTTTSMDQAIQWIRDALKWDTLVFDYETTGLAPYKTGHEILCASISDGMFGYAFPFFKDERFQLMWKKLLTSKIKLIAHNNQFEALWTRQMCGYWPESWYWDTMLGQHCLHNLKPTNLKYCTYVTTGDVGYDDAVDQYIAPSDADTRMYGTHAFNRLKELPISEILPYCALDSLYSYKIYEKQKLQLTPYQQEGLAFLVESADSLIRASHHGIAVDPVAFERGKREADEFLAQQRAELMAMPEIALWDEAEPLNIDSPPQMAHLFFDILKYKPVSFTSKAQKPSVDKVFLEKSDTPFSRKLIQYRELTKMIGTYLSDYGRETVDGYVHPWFNLNTVETFRSSARSVNIQNLPKRNKEVKRLLRSFIVPKQGAKIVEYDFKSLEVVIGGCHSQDKSMKMYIEDPTSDMHRDSALDCFIMTPEEITKPHRNAVKSLFNFSILYGNYYKNMAKGLWEYVTENGLLDHMKKHGITTYQQYEDKIKEAERVFWEDRFPEHNAWRKQMWREYQNNGYLESYTGFRMQAPMSRNNSMNCKIQGDGYHVLQWMMNRITKYCENKGLRSRPIAEIHDSLVMNVYPEEETLIDYAVWLYGTVKVRQYWPWINLPLVIEKESSAVDGTWAEMSECGALHYE